MNVLKEGILPEREMEVTCSFCTAVLKIGYNDLEKDNYRAVECPCCLQQVEIEEADMPRGMLREIENEKEKRKIRSADFIGVIM